MWPRGPSRLIAAQRHLILPILLTYFVQWTVGFCPGRCICDDEPNLQAACVDNNLDVVPIQLNPGLRVIDLSRNQITSVNYTLTFYMQLQLLNLTQNKIDNLGSNNFMSQTELRVLDLSTNSLKQLSKDAFRGLIHLKRLLLNDNQIADIHQHALPKLSGLVELNLRNNRIAHLSEGTLEHLVNLRVLILENNELLEIPGAGNFQFLHRLVFLNLRKNLIAEVHNESFNGLSTLSYLHLGENVLRQVDEEAFVPLTNLRWLDLSDNNLTTLPTKAMSKLTNLTNLSMSGNTFEQLPPVAFLNMFSLRELHLDRLKYLTKIDSRAFVDNTFLVRLSMDNNQGVSDLPARLFHGNPHLTDISMRGNGFTTLDAAQFPLDRLNRLQLSENPFICNCSLLWLWRLIQEEEKLRFKPTSATPLTWTTDFWGDWDFLDSDEDEFWQADRFGWSSQSINSAAKSNLLIVDRNEIGCDVVVSKDPVQRVRRQLLNLEEGDIQCPTQMLTIICAVLTIIVVLLTCFSILFYLQFTRRRKKVLEERKNVNERIVPQHVNKLDLERYLTGQQVLHPHQMHLASAPSQSAQPAASLMATMYHQQQQKPQQQQQHINLFGGNTLLPTQVSKQPPPQTNLNEYHQHKPSWDVQFPPPPLVSAAATLVPSPAPAEDELDDDHNYHVESRNASPLNDFNYHTTKSQYSPQKKFNFLPHQSHTNSHQHHHRTLQHDHDPHHNHQLSYLQQQQHPQQQQQHHHKHSKHPNRWHQHESGANTLSLGGFNKKFLFANAVNSSSSSSSSSTATTAVNPHENLINNDADTDHYEQFEYLDCRPNKHLPLQRHQPMKAAAGDTVDQPHVVYV